MIGFLQAANGSLDLFTVRYTCRSYLTKKIDFLCCFAITTKVIQQHIYPHVYSFIHIFCLTFVCCLDFIEKLQYFKVFVSFQYIP